MTGAFRCSLVWTICVGVLVMALVGPPTASGATAASHLEVFAPWSMEKRLRRIVELFQEKYPTTPVRFTTGTPGLLIKKVKRGAYPSVYIAMGPEEIEILESLGLTVEGSAKEILKQTLVLALSAEASELVKEVRDLAKKEIRSVGIGQPALTCGRLTRVALSKLGVLGAVEPKGTTSPLRSLVLGKVQAAVIYEQCCYEEDLFVGEMVPRRGIAAAEPLPKELCEPFPVIAVAIKKGQAPPSATRFIQVLGEKQAQDILHRRGEWSCPICEMEP